jgi:hypothetical protein
MNINHAQALNCLVLNRRKKQQGVVLVVALVFLVALTAVASMLMLNATTDMKMAGASQEKIIALQEAVGSVDELVYQQITQVNNFARSQYDGDIMIEVTAKEVTASIGVPKNKANNDEISTLETDCPASHKPSSIFKCNILAVKVEKKYGRQNTSNIVIRAGVVQQLLNIGGSS